MIERGAQIKVPSGSLGLQTCHMGNSTVQVCECSSHVERKDRKDRGPHLF
jgi:hypothetical protein